MIGFLSEFWNAITAATEGTIEWFQSVGNAVAGAIGNLLFYPLQAIIDFGLAWAYLLDRLFNIINYLILPFFYMFDFLAAFVAGAFEPQEVDLLITNSDNLQTFFNSLPLFSEIIGLITAGLWVLIIVKTLNALKY